MVAIAASLLVVAVTLWTEVGAACTSPYTRPSWSDLSSSQKAAYVAAAKKLYDRPTSGQCIDPKTASHRDFTQCHFSYKNDYHNTMYFWPWHRKFIRTYELALQSIDPSVILPYIDWQQYSQAPHRADIWNEAYFGPDGDSSKGNCVTKGAFGGTTVTFKDGANTVSHCFKRIWSPGNGVLEAFHPTEVVMGILDNPNFSTVSKNIEGVVHGTVHFNIGGEMNTMYSTADPVFFLHHAYVDRLWWYWHTACPSWATNFAPASEASESRQLTPYSERVLDVMSTVGGPFCYTYSRRDSDRAMAKCPKQPPPTTTTTTTTTAPTTSTQPTATTRAASPKWLQNFIVDLAPGLPKKLHRREGLGDAAFYNNTEIPGLNQTNSNNIVLSDTPVNLNTNTTLNQTISINGTELTIEKKMTVIPGTNVTLTIPVVNGTVALNYVAPDVSEANLAIVYIPEDYEDDYVPLSFTGNIAVYTPPKKTVKTAKELEAAQANGDTEVVLVLDKNDSTDLENLRHVSNLPLSYIKMMHLDVASVRFMETYANTLVDVINMTPGYTSPDALKNLCK